MKFLVIDAASFFTDQLHRISLLKLEKLECQSFQVAQSDWQERRVILFLDEMKEPALESHFVLFVSPTVTIKRANNILHTKFFRICLYNLLVKKNTYESFFFH